MSNTTSQKQTSQVDNIERLKQGVVYSESEILKQLKLNILILQLRGFVLMDE